MASSPALKRLELANFTVFSKASFEFSPSLNVIVGENGAGKSHLLKLLYTATFVSHDHNDDSLNDQPLTKASLEPAIATKLVDVFKPDALGRLARRKQGRERSDVSIEFNESALDIEFSFASNSKSEVKMGKVPRQALQSTSVFLPTRELLSIAPGFVSIYDRFHLEFDDTWRDTCLLLELPAARGPREARVRDLIRPIEHALGGTIVERQGRFYLKSPGHDLEIHLLAEGLRKLGMLARLISTGVLLDSGILFWDEPEANLNPRMIREVAKMIAALSGAGVQCFIATHSLFLLREIELLQTEIPSLRTQTSYIGLTPTSEGVVVSSGSELADIGDFSALEESLAQTDRYLDTLA